MGIVAYLGEVCRELRVSRFEEKGGFWELGYHISGGHGRGSRALRAFEAGQPVDHVDEKVEAYAAACKVNPTWIVVEACKRLQAGEELTPLGTDGPIPSTDSDATSESGPETRNDPATEEGTG